MRRLRYGIAYPLLLSYLYGFFSLCAAAPTPYTLSDFQWYVRHADGRKQRTELLSQLSRRHVLVGVLWSDLLERNRKLQDIQTFIQRPPVSLPPFQQVQPGPSSEQFATYVITTAEDQSLAGVAVLLNTLQNLESVDYALPVIQLSRGAAAPFIDFTVVFTATADAQAIANFLRRQPVIVLSQHQTTYRLRLSQQAATNVLVVLRAFEEATPLVEDVQATWLDTSVSQPVALSPQAAFPLPKRQVALTSSAVEARVRLDTGWAFPLVDVRQPVTYHLEIDHAAQIHIAPASIAPTALRRALARETGLPPELFDLTDVHQQTDPLPGERRRLHVAYSLRVSKPGTYRIPALQIAYSLQDAPNALHQLQSLPQEGYLLTIDAHLPLVAETLPGDILPAPHLQTTSWPRWRYLALGLLAVGGLLLALGAVSTTAWRRRRPARAKPLSRRQLRQQYQSAFRALQEHMPTETGTLTVESRTWLRDCARLLRRLVGEREVGEATVFEGGAGISHDMILAYLHRPSTASDASFKTALHLIEELDVLATAPAPRLSREDYERFSEAVQQTLLLLTSKETPRVFRPSPGA